MGIVIQEPWCRSATKGCFLFAFDLQCITKRLFLVCLGSRPGCNSRAFQSSAQSGGGRELLQVGFALTGIDFLLLLLLVRVDR